MKSENVLEGRGVMTEDLRPGDMVFVWANGQNFDKENLVRYFAKVSEEGHVMAAGSRESAIVGRALVEWYNFRRVTPEDLRAQIHAPPKWTPVMVSDTGSFERTLYTDLSKGELDEHGKILCLSGFGWKHWQVIGSADDIHIPGIKD
jgi:hypothetical protein